MSRRGSEANPYPLVWWLKKALPHRHGQACKEAAYFQLPEDEIDKQRWMGKDARCFEFSDGTLEWGPKRGARYPNREWKDTFEHRDPDCVGEWVHAAGGYACPKCEQWVRRNDTTRLEFDRLTSAVYSLNANVKAAEWSNFFAMIPERKLERLLAKLLSLDWHLVHDCAFNIAVADAGLSLDDPICGTKVGKGSHWAR